MYELIQVSGNSYYIQSPAKIGLVKVSDTEVCLIDSGNDKDAGKKIRRVLEEKGWTLKAIYNTHSHADHIGGNKYLQVQTGCEVYAPGIEQYFTSAPILEPAFLYGGCPGKELRHKFLMAQGSVANPLTKADLPVGWEMIELPGHSFDMVGFRTQDDVVYLADCLSSKETVDKYKIGFIYDVGAYVETLEKVKAMRAKMFVPAHAPATEEIAELAQYNIDKVYEVADKIVELCSNPIGFEQLLKELFEAYELTMTYEQHALVGSTVRSYLTWLKECGRITAFIEENVIVYKQNEAEVGENAAERR